jgi:hypothetical protein
VEPRGHSGHGPGAVLGAPTSSPSPSTRRHGTLATSALDLYILATHKLSLTFAVKIVPTAMVTHALAGALKCNMIDLGLLDVGLSMLVRATLCVVVSYHEGEQD